MKKKQCKHEWRPIISKNLLDKGYGSISAQIGSFCMKCKKETKITII